MKPGRKQIAPEERSIGRIVSMPPDAWARADAAAKERGLTRSAFVRAAIDYFCNATIIIKSGKG